MWPVGTLNWCQNCVASCHNRWHSQQPVQPKRASAGIKMGPSTSDIITSFENDQKNMVFSALRYSTSDPSSMSRLKAEEKLLWSVFSNFLLPVAHLKTAGVFSYHFKKYHATAIEPCL